MNKVALTDDELIHQYSLGNSRAITELFNRHYLKLIRYVYFKVKDKQLAEDIVQESFIKLLHSIRENRYKESGRFYYLLVSIARNTCIDYFRKQNKQPHFVEITNTNVLNIRGDNNDNTDEPHTIKRIRQIIDNLSEEEREIVILRHYADLSFKDIAALTGININTALGRMRNALQHIRKIVAEQQIRQ